MRFPWILPSCRLATAFGIVVVALAAGVPVLASVQVNSVQNSAQDYAGFNYFSGSNIFNYEPYQHSNVNYSVNAAAVVSDSYSNQPNFPYLSSYASGQNGTDYSTYIYAQGYAQSYTNPYSNYGYNAYNQAQASSQIVFTLSDQSTANLFLEAYAYTDNPGAFGTNQAVGYAELYDYATGTYYSFQAISQNGGPSQYFSTTLQLTLDPGVYRLAYGSAYTYGNSYNGSIVGGGSDNYQYASGTANLFNIQPVPSAAATPEPLSLLVWGGLIAVVAVRRNKREKKWTGPN